MQIYVNVTYVLLQWVHFGCIEPLSCIIIPFVSQETVIVSLEYFHFKGEHLKTNIVFVLPRLVVFVFYQDRPVDRMEIFC